MAEYLTKPIAERLARLARTPDDVAAAIDGRSDALLSQRPDDRNWSAKEIVCHLRDVEELFLLRFQTILAMDDPKILAFGAAAEDLVDWGIGGPVGHPLDPDRWAEERQYRRNDGREALKAFQRRRSEGLALLRTLSPEQWQRGGLHPTRGRLVMGDWVASLVAHDDKHLAQLARALA